jgi:hypothetical protein
MAKRNLAAVSAKEIPCHSNHRVDDDQNQDVHRVGAQTDEWQDGEQDKKNDKR